MKFRIAALCLPILACATALHGADKNAADYPIKFTILETHMDTDRWGVHATGRGRINNAGQVNGVEFQYDCDEKLGVAYGGEFFAAKWKKEPEEITVLSHGMGDEHKNTCDVKVTVREFIFVTKNGHLTTETQQQWAARHAGKDHAEGDDAPPPQN